VSKKGALQAEAARITSANDTPEVKVQKLYGRVQEIRNLSYESGKSKKEEHEEKIKSNGNAEDVLKHGYGTGRDINFLFNRIDTSGRIFRERGIRGATERKRIFARAAGPPSTPSRRGMGARGRQGDVSRSGVEVSAVRDATVGGNGYERIEGKQGRRGIS